MPGERAALPAVAVIGSAACDETVAAAAERVGELIAQRGAVMVCGGLGGVMEAAARGARSKGGLTMGILPGATRGECNKHISIPVVTDMGHSRNVIIAQTAQGLVAVEGEYGTLSEICIALKLGKPVSAIGRWAGIPGVMRAATPEEAVDQVFRRIG